MPDFTLKEIIDVLGGGAGALSATDLKAVAAQLAKQAAAAPAAAGIAGLGAGGAGAAGATAAKGWLSRLMGYDVLKGAGGGAAAAAGLGFGANLLADYLMSKGAAGKATQKLARAVRNPRQLVMSMQENIAEQETAKAMEAARMRKLQTEVAGTDPKMYQLLHSLAAGDAFPRLGPGEARVGGSSLISDDVLDRAIANSDIWDAPRGATNLFGR